MATELDADKVVLYTGELNYDPPTAKRPTSVRMTLELEDGTQLFDTTVPDVQALSKKC